MKSNDNGRIRMPKMGIMRTGLAACGLALAGLISTGCGGGGGSSSSSTSAGGPPPAELVGTYTTTLKRSDLPKPVPPEFTSGLKWELKIARSGGIDNAPNLVINNLPSTGGCCLENPTLSVSGDTLNLTHETCESSGYTFVNSAYRWKLSGKTLLLTLTKPGCPDKVAQTILASEPWRKR
jgi:hypothetical protein